MNPGDAIAAVTKAAGVKPCGGCKKRQYKLNAMFSRIPLPDDYRLRMQGFRGDTQVLLAEGAADWATFLYDGKAVTEKHTGTKEEMICDFDHRMKAKS